MISTRKRNTMRNTIAYAFYNQIQKESGLGAPQFAILLAIHAIQQKTNHFVVLDQIRVFIPTYSKESIKHEVVELKALGLIDSAGIGLVNVTDKGEYFIRGTEIAITRVVNETKLSRWERLKKNDGRRIKLRRKTIKGTKQY